MALVLAVVLAWYFAIRSVPDYNASFQVTGIKAPVEIVRSTENVPHIFGQSDEDVFFALGFAHAQDRLFQMTILRRAAQGRLSEINGPSTFALDDLVRRLELYHRAAASVDVQDPETLAALKSYSAGVNEWVRQVNERAMGRGAPEFFLFKEQFAYWQPADSLAIFKLLALGASKSVGTEVLRARLSLAWPEHGPELLPPDSPAPALLTYTSLFPDGRLGPPEGREPDANPFDLQGFLQPGAGIGGNAFAVANNRTAADGALLANDPQMILTAPSLFYLARLELRSGGVIGATIPGIPAVLSGRNPRLAWGLTPALLDDADIYIEEIKPGDPDSYRGVSGWEPFETRKETIDIFDSPSKTITLRRTENGPVVPGIDPGLPDVTPAGHIPALRWIGLSSRDKTMSALIGLMGSRDIAGAKAVTSQVVAPVMQVTLADTDNVVQYIAGTRPVRSGDHPTGGAMPVPGWLPEARWQHGPIIAKNDTSQTGDIVIATDEHARGLRRGRLLHLLEDREIHSRDSLISAQIDVISPAARSLLPLVGANLWFSGEPAAPGTPQRQRQDALTLLAEWDGEMGEYLPEPLIYAAWMQQLQQRLIRDEIGPVADEITQLFPDFIESVFRNRNGAARWCNIVQSAQEEDCTTIARQALDLAILDLTDQFGPNVTSWRWGDLHEVQQFHPGLGQVSGLGWVLNLTQSVSGGDFTVARSGLLGSGKNPFRAVNGAGYRGVYDLADPDSSVFIISTGQSGHPFSRHYDDLADLWRRGEYIGMSLDPGLARAASVGVTHLAPDQPRSQ